MHRCNELRKHQVGLLSFAAHVLHHRLVAFGHHQIDHDGPGLPKAPAAADGLIVGFEGMIGEVDDVCAMLEIQSPGPDPRLANEDAGLALDEGLEALRFVLVRLPAMDLDGIGDEPFEQIPLGIEMAPDQGGLVMGYQLRDLLAAFLNGAAALLTLLLEADGRHFKEKAIGESTRPNEVLPFLERWQDKRPVIAPQIRGLA